ncbi:LEA type 2 family protein [Pontibacter russatus]|uniref:LEA type 2 family protein n=1 Tax=Pontibacter russatus TaxID=2694929 RepID=UPI00137AE610|nr:LEA type 2 family protein [Pontibacter russatus]
MHNKVKWAILAVVLLALVGGGLYYFLKKIYHPKVENVSSLRLELTNDTALVRAGVQVQNRLPLPITFDSIHYTISDKGTLLGWGQMTEAQTLPPLADKVLDFRLMLHFDKYRRHLQDQQEKDSIQLAVKADVFFDLPLISPRSVTLNRHLTVPVPKAPSMQLKDVTVRSFSVNEGYSFLLKIDATNQNLPELRIKDFAYSIQVGDTLTISGRVDTTFRVQQGGSRLLEIPLQLKTSDAVALIKKMLTGGGKWDYDARVTAQIESSHRLLDSFKLTVEKAGALDVGKMGSGTGYMPSLSQVKRLEIDSGEEQTLLQAEVVVHNPAPIPFYIDSASYFIRHNGNVIASGKKDFETVLKKSANQTLHLGLLVDESAYDQFMKNMQGQDTANIEIALNLLYDLPGAERQRIQLKRQVQVPVQGQASIQVADLSLQELSPQKGASLTLSLKVQHSNLPDLRLRNLDYTLDLGENLVLTGHTREPIHIGRGDSLVEVPVQLSAKAVNQLVDKALRGDPNWKYDLQATAELVSSNDMIGSPTLDFEFSGVLEMGNGMGGKKLTPRITSIDSLYVNLHHDTAWVELNLHVKNPLPVNFKIDSLLLTLSHANDTFAISRESVGKVLPADSSQSAWLRLGVNAARWQQYLHQQQQHDSLRLKQSVTLVYQVEDLPRQRSTFHTTLQVATPDTPVVALQQVKLRGFSFTRGLLLEALVEVQNANVQELAVRDLTYDACVENILDASATVNRTYRMPQGDNTVRVPISLGVGEAFRALFAKLTGNSRPRNILVHAEATVDTGNPTITGTFVRAEIWQKAVLFQKKARKSR